MSFTPELYSNQGQIEVLPVVLFCDYVGQKVELKKLDEKKECCSGLSECHSVLKVSEDDCI